MTETNNIASYFFESAHLYPEKTAIIRKGKSITYQQLASEVKTTASYFNTKGIGTGDRVLVFVPMSLDLYRVVLALFYIGATVVFLDEWVGVKRMEECCKIANCKAFIGGWKIHALSFISSALKAIPVKLKLRNQKYQREISMTSVALTDTALLTFTTGSTGLPKAAKRTHGFLKEQFMALKEVIEPQADDIDLTILPIVLLINLGIGSTSIIADFKASKPQDLKPQNIFAQITNHKINRITASPYFVSRISDFAIENSLPTIQIKKIFTGGGPVFPKEAGKMIKAFPIAKTTIVYGSTEAEPISTIEAKDLVNSNSSFLTVGFPNQNIKICILPIVNAPLEVENESHFLSMRLKQGDIGEITVSGSYVLNEYYNSDAAFRRNKIVVGQETWHRTGDAGLINEQGELELAGRCESIIKYREGYIYPFLFENKCLDIPGIKLATILELNNKIIVVVEEENKNKQLVIKEQLTNIIPRDAEIAFIDKMPKDPRHFSKIDYHRLKEILQA